MGMALIWVDVPKVEGGQRQDLWMYYGNQKAAATANGQLTFDPNYTALYHFDGATGPATPRPTATLQRHRRGIDGVIGRALQFSGQPLLLPASPSLQHAAGGAFTFSAWLRLDQANGEQLFWPAAKAPTACWSGQPGRAVRGDRRPARGLQPATEPGQWQHLALTAEGEKSRCVNGREAASLAVAMPAFNSRWPLVPICRAAAAPAIRGAMDELRLSKVARPAALLLADATAQGAESKLVAYGVDEEQSGFGFGSLGFLLNAVPVDAWVIIAVLVLMMFQSWIIMLRKNRLSRVSKANEIFREQFAQSARAWRCSPTTRNWLSVWPIRRCGACTGGGQGNPHPPCPGRRHLVGVGGHHRSDPLLHGRRAHPREPAAQLQTLDPVQRHRRRPLHRPARHRAGDHGGVPRHRHGR
jgi:biopolymer transport protein ExbB